LKRLPGKDRKGREKLSGRKVIPGFPGGALISRGYVTWAEGTTSNGEGRGMGGVETMEGKV